MAGRVGGTVRTSVVLYDRLRRDLRCRGDLSAAIRRALEGYFALLDVGRMELRGILSEGECGILALAVDDVMPLGWYNSLEDAVAAIDDSSYRQFEVDREKLLAKLRGLSALQYEALEDALQRYSTAANTGMRVRPSGMLDDPLL